jgi:hypothetical protein
MTASKNSISILMLHGFGQSGRLFQIKTKSLVAKLTSVLAILYQIEEDDVNFVFPDGPVSLVAERRDSPWEEAAICSASSGMYAWSRYNEVTESVQYSGLDQSMAKLVRLCELHGPFVGALGFSTGATLASMFAAWCESSSRPDRRHALKTMCQATADHELTSVLGKPPQGLLDFAIFCSGFPGTPAYYHAFYKPKILTPTVHAVATWDSMVPRVESMRLIESCHNPIVIEHEGMHHVPRGRGVVDQIAQSISTLLLMSRAQVPPRSIVTAPEGSRKQDMSGDELSKTRNRSPIGNLPPIWQRRPDMAPGPLSDAASLTDESSYSERSSISNRSHRRPIVRRFRLAGTR